MTTPARATAILGLALVLVPVADHRLSSGDTAGCGLVVHEWGTFTTVAGRDGRPMFWSPLSAVTDLPTFVRHSYGIGKEFARGTVRMETPVLYFYADTPLTVSATVAFPHGRITEWYPEADYRESAIHWPAVRVLPHLERPLPREQAPSHYYPARETDAALLRIATGSAAQYEKFLFYRGVGTFPLPLTARVEGAMVRLEAGPEAPLGAVVLFERRGDEVGYSVHQLAAGDTVADRPALGASLDSLLPELETILVSHGLYGKEARAMIDSWQDTWFEEGCRVFYVVPRSRTDAILPLALDPQPTELVRVLVGRIELLTPERRRDVEEDLLRLEDEEVVASTSAGWFGRLGRYAEPFLRQILETAEDEVVRSRAMRLLFGPPPGQG